MSAPEIQRLQAMVRHLQSQTKAQLQEIKAAASKGNPVLSVVDVRERTSEILRVLPCLTERQARAFLFATESSAGVRRRELLELMVPWIDERYGEIRDALAEIWLPSGEHGRATIDAAIREVNKLRRQRGAVELASIDTLLQVMEHQAREAGQEFDAERFVQIAPDVLKAFQLEEGGTGVAVGGFGLVQLEWLRQIKRVIARDWPELANPFRTSADRYYQRVAAMYEAAARKRLGPLDAEREHELRQYARLYPGTQFVDARGVKTWGGRWANKRVQSPAHESVAVQGPQRATEVRVLTAYGEALLRQYREQDVVGAYGLASRPDVVQQHQVAVERRREELLSGEPHPEYGPTWRVNVSLEELGYATREITVEIDAPDKPHEQLFGGQSVSDLIEAMGAAMTELGLDVGQDAARLVP